MSAPDEDEIEVIMHSNEDLTEFTVVIKSKQKMSTEEICIELESLAHELNRADDQLKQPGVSVH